MNASNQLEPTHPAVKENVPITDRQDTNITRSHSPFLPSVAGTYPPGCLRFTSNCTTPTAFSVIPRSSVSSLLCGLHQAVRHANKREGEVAVQGHGGGVDCAVLQEERLELHFYHLSLGKASVFGRCLGRKFRRRRFHFAGRSRNFQDGVDVGAAWRRISTGPMPTASGLKFVYSYAK